MVNYLEIKAQEFKGNKVFFKVVYQAFRDVQFFDGKNSFLASNQIKLMSSYLPLCRPDVVYVHGSNPAYDNEILKCDLSKYLQIVQAVKEYNEQR